mmetsp:Transcript_78990/g.212035  ORF Transcript_78990/g.212035 Transcript_78990/m.212035 type:complete len:425 (-) Transcript_78990:82-1356(-)
MCTVRRFFITIVAIVVLWDFQITRCSPSTFRNMFDIFKKVSIVPSNKAALKVPGSVRTMECTQVRGGISTAKVSSTQISSRKYFVGSSYEKSMSWGPWKQFCTEQNFAAVRTGVLGLRNGMNYVSKVAKDVVRKIYDTRRFLAAGAVGRCVAVSIMFPIDTIKTRLQTFGGSCCNQNQWSQALRFPIYNGLSSSLLGQVPNGMLVYGSYELYKKELAARFPQLDANQVRFISAIMGDITGSVWIVPFESVKQRVQAGLFPNVGIAFSTVLQKEGFRGLFRGYRAQVMRDVTYHAIQLPLYEAVKSTWGTRISLHNGKPRLNSLRKSQREMRRLAPWENLLCGAIAGATSGALTTPLDVMKTRLMTMSSAKGPQMLEMLKQMWKTEGLQGFTAGLPQRSAYISVGSAIFFTVFEAVQHQLRDVET